MTRIGLVVAVISSLAVGCGSDGGMNAGDDAPPGDAPPVTPDGPPIPEGYTRLIGRTWSIPAGSLDKYKCVRFTVPEDMYITNIVAQAPLGTHHTVLSFVGGNAPPGPDGEQDCNVGTLGMVMLYASGVGTSPLDFPDGVGVKISAGQQIHLNLHLFNATDAPLSGDSAILVKAQPTPPPMLAEMVFAGKFAFAIPANNQPYTTSGGCTVNQPYTLFAVWPHMHQLATHQKVELIRTGQTTVLHDSAFDFNEQKYYPQSPMVQVQPNDRINVSCTWVNDTGSIVTFGDSSNKEMCFAGLYRYPAMNSGLFQCTDNPGF
ncbi:MAG: monooxygenase [Kofleriaceae bacterium]